MSKTVIDLIRHGEPVGGKRYRGQVDDPLSDKGWQQMWNAVGEFAGWQHIVTSPLQRCAAFADALGQKLGLEVTRDNDLKEVGFGEWEGRTAAEIAASDPQRVLRFKQDPIAHAPPGAEPLAQFHLRVGRAWQRIAENHRGRHVLVVGHAGVIRMFIAHALGLAPESGYRINVENAAITRLQIEWVQDFMLPSLIFHSGKLETAPVPVAVTSQ
jgi:alpha-ribazole phosphatase